MEKRIYKTHTEAGSAIAADIATLLNKKPNAVFCLAAGHSSLPVFAALVDSNMDFSRARFVTMDEWTGFDLNSQGSCSWFMRHHFYNRRQDIPERNILWFNPLATDLAAESARMEVAIEQLGGIDYLLLGMGMNGHLALNEPGDRFDAGVHAVALAEKTREVAVKYFKGDMPDLTGGITLGIKNMLASRQICMCVFGVHKQPVVQQLLQSQVTESFPASVLKTVPKALLVLDADAAGENGAK